jgi:hypothetical protein
VATQSCVRCKAPSVRFDWPAGEPSIVAHSTASASGIASVPLKGAVCLATPSTVKESVCYCTIYVKCHTNVAGARKGSSFILLAGCISLSRSC